MHPFINIAFSNRYLPEWDY